MLAQDLTAQSKDLILAADGKDVSEFLARRLSLVIVRLSQVLLDQETDPAKQWEQVCNINRELSRLRRDDHRSVQLAQNRRRLDLQSRDSGLEMRDAALGRLCPAPSRDELWSLESDAHDRREDLRAMERAKNQPPASRETSNLKVQKEQTPAAGQTAAAHEIAGKKETKATQPNPSLSDLSAPAEPESSQTPHPPAIGLCPASGTSNSQRRGEALECSGEVEKSGQIQINPTKSNLSKPAAGGAEIPIFNIHHPEKIQAPTIKRRGADRPTKGERMASQTG